MVPGGRGATAVQKTLPSSRAGPPCLASSGCGLRRPSVYVWGARRRWCSEAPLSTCTWYRQGPAMLIPWRGATPCLEQRVGQPAWHTGARPCSRLIPHSLEKKKDHSEALRRVHGEEKHAYN
ncbi:unnamed protein product [Eretmochelys imbricata]